MKMKAKQTLCTLLLVLTLLITVVSAGAAEQADNTYISIYIYGERLVTDVPAALINGRVLAPFRPVFESLGAEVTWDYDLNMAVAHRDSTEIELIINNKEAWIDKQKVQLDVAPMIISGRTMVPVRFISETLGEPVRWDGETRTVYIGEKKIPEDTSWVKEYTLKSDSPLAYQPGKNIVFQGGTRVTMRSRDFVESGILKNDSILRLSNRKGASATFKGGTKVLFDEKGYVIQGIVAQETKVEYAPLESVSLNLLPYRDRNQVLIKKDTLIGMDDEGYLKKGIIAEDSDVPYSDKRIVSLKGDTEVIFGSGGMLSKGILDKKAVLEVGQNRQAAFKAGTPVEFLNGKVIQGTLYDDYELRYRGGYDTDPALFKRNTVVELNEQGFVRRGVLAEDTSLCYQERRFVGIKKETGVEFFDNGLLQQGHLATTAVLPVSPIATNNFAANTRVTFDSNGFVVHSSP
jgi:hypothetical protein